MVNIIEEYTSNKFDLIVLSSHNDKITIPPGVKLSIGEISLQNHSLTHDFVIENKDGNSVLKMEKKSE